MNSLMYGGLFKYKEEGLLILRVLFGITLMYHGYAKFVGGEKTLIAVGSALSYFGISGGYWALGAFAAFVELVGGLFVALGFATRISAFFMIGTLFVASVMMMITKGYGPASHAIDDMFAFIGIFVAGPGKYSFDYKMAPEKEKK